MAKVLDVLLDVLLDYFCSVIYGSLNIQRPQLVSVILAPLLTELGDIGAAKSLLERALAIHQKVLGPEHPDTTKDRASLDNLVPTTNGKPATIPNLANVRAGRSRKEPKVDISHNSLYSSRRLLGSQGRPPEFVGTGEQTDVGDVPHSAAQLSTKEIIQELTARGMRDITRRALEVDLQYAGRTRWLDSLEEKPTHLRGLEAIPFLKSVWAKEIKSWGGVIKKEVRRYDDDLMAAVEAYISNRIKRGQDLGEAGNLRFVKGPVRGRGCSLTPRPAP
jgi:hypothetical protein